MIAILNSIVKLYSRVVFIFSFHIKNTSFKKNIPKNFWLLSCYFRRVLMCEGIINARKWQLELYIKQNKLLYMYRITAIMKFETDIITMSCDIYMFVETFKTDNIVFIGNIIRCLMSYWLIIFRIGQIVDTENINLWDQRNNAQNYW